MTDAQKIPACPATAVSSRSPPLAPTASRRCSPCPGRTSSRCTTARCRRSRGTRPADAAPRRPARADRGVRGRGHGQADPRARPRGAHRRARRHQRHQRHRPGAVRRLTDGRRRRSRPAEPLGQRQPPGARPAADRREHHQARDHADDGRRRARRHGQRLHRGGLVAPRPGLRRRADGRVLQLLIRSRPDRRTPHGRRPGHRRDRPDRRAPGGRRATRADPRHRRLGRRRRGRRAAAGRVARTARPDQRHGPWRDPRRPPAADHQGPQRGAQQGRPRDRGGHPARLPARLRHLRRQRGGVLARPDCPHRRLGRAGLAARRAGRVGLGRPHPGLRRPARRGRARSAYPGVGPGSAWDRLRGRRGPPSSRTP